MVEMTVVRNFFAKYGSKIQTPDLKEWDYGVITSIKRYASDKQDWHHHKAGVETNEEYVLLSLGESGIIQKGKNIIANGKTFRVINTDHYYYANQPLYLRAYLQPVKTKTISNDQGDVV